MSFVESVKSAFASKKESARAEYQKALAGGKPAERVVALALAAGLTEVEIATDAGVVDRAAALAEAADGYAELAKKLADANQRHDTIAAEYSAAVESFTQRLNAAAEEVETAQAAETPARKAVEELAKLHREHSSILPPAPPAVKELLAKEDREAEVARSREPVMRARSKAGAIERELLQARNSGRTPGSTNRAMFEPASAAGVVGNISQPVLQDDRAEAAAKQSAAVILETQLREATATAERMAAEHAAKFNDRV